MHYHKALEWIRALQLNAHQIRNMFVSSWNGWDTRCINEYNIATIDCDKDMNEIADELICTYEQAVHYHALAMNEQSTEYVEKAVHLYQKVGQLI